ncbi:MAG: DUF1553 domain-containing protein [Bryobacteraceae bacterium]
MTVTSRLALIILSVILCLAPSLQAQQTPAKIDFQREVRPILSDSCFHCHGPDKETRMAGLRLDTREGAFSHRKNGTPITPGKPDESLLYQRISAPQAARRMPPAYSHKTLTAKQIDTLKRWIESGADWKEHWAFIIPSRPDVPPVKDAQWARTPIDRFLLAKMESAGLAPAATAGKRTLIRRVSLDLTGLPPTPEQVEAFVSDPAPDAYEKLVDRLLASPQYGEHRARYWLDAARYADTHGLHIDNYREMWPYRDWVINAFNRNMPFDKFTVEQIAGDLLPNRTLEQQIASGFHRCQISTNEGGVIEKEVEAIYAKDRVDTTGTVFLGLTIGCATCHDHKFDPILQKDFYSMAAFFRNTTQAALDGNIPDTPPIVVVPKSQDRPRWLELNAEVESLRNKSSEARKAPNASFDRWMESKERKSMRTPLEASAEILAVSVEGGPRISKGHSGKTLALTSGVTFGESENRQALRFAAKSALTLPTLDQITGDKPFSISTLMYMPKGEGNFTVASQLNRIKLDPPQVTKEGDVRKEILRGWSIELNARTPFLRLFGDDGKGIQIRGSSVRRLKPGTWYQLTFTYDGTREQDGLGLYVDGASVPTEGGGDAITHLTGTLRTKSPLILGGDGKDRYYTDGALADLRIFDRVITEEESRLVGVWPDLAASKAKEASQLSEGQKNALRLYFLNGKDPAYRALIAQTNKVNAERREIRRRGAVTLVMAEKTDTQPMAHILYRGQYDQEREAVEPNSPSALPAMKDSMPRNRLGLAEWLVDPQNPLVARVTVNRFWQELFGTGIVKTAGDFGSQGEVPSHPELLDWLAVEFRESGWDVKKLFRLMVTSAAYMQESAATDEKTKKDPDNRLLARGPRFRMDAEMVRDYALAASGLLVPTIGGPSVKPYQPDGLWETVAMQSSNTRFYKQDHGDKLYRRSLYTFWKRSAPPASMDIFNAPTRESCTVRREQTDTPLQALVTMNDPQFVEAARSLADHAMVSGGNKPDAEFDFLSAHLLARPLDSREREITSKSYKDFLNYYDSHPADAKKLLAVGESKANPKLPVPEFAALTVVTNQLLNLDEVLNK